MMDDNNLWDVMLNTLNQVEQGWNDDIDGNFLVYLDPSPHLTQFTSPVLLKIVHDETNVIRSEVVKSYPEQDPADPEVMQGVLEDAIKLFPAQSHGLIIPDLSVLLFRLAGRSGASGNPGSKGFFGVVHP